VNSKQIYDMLETNKENSHFTFKKTLIGRDCETVPLNAAARTGENSSNTELLRRLEKAEKEI
jgi:hypothetical protein